MARAGQDKIDPAVLKSALILVVGALAVVFDTTIVSVALHPLDDRVPAGARHRGAAEHLGPAALRRQAAVDVLPTHLSWRFMFWVNVPFCAVGLYLAARFMAGDAPHFVRPEKSPAST